MTRRFKRREHLTDEEKARFTRAAESLSSEIGPMFIVLRAFGPAYKALFAISEAIRLAYEPLEIEQSPRSEEIASSVQQRREDRTR